IEQSSVQGEDPDQNGPDKATDPVHRNGPHWIIDLQSFIDQPNGKDHGDTADQANGQSAPGIDSPTSGSDSHQPGQGTVQAHGNVRSEEHTSELQSRENLVCRLL